MQDLQLLAALLKLMEKPFTRILARKAVYSELVINKVCSFVYEFLRIIDEEFKLNMNLQLDKFNNELVKIEARK